jgi:IS5 family transposase
MFKILILQQLYNIADEKTEYQINDRLSFRTIWLFREQLRINDTADKLFRQIIVKHEETNAALHDSQKIADLIDKKDEECWADTGYVGAEIEKDILEKNPALVLHINEKGYRKRPNRGFKGAIKDCLAVYLKTHKANHWFLTTKRGKINSKWKFLDVPPIMKSG